MQDGICDAGGGSPDIAVPKSKEKNSTGGRKQDDSKKGKTTKKKTKAVAEQKSVEDQLENPVADVKVG